MEDVIQFAGVMAVLLGMPLTIMFVFGPLAKAFGRRLEGAGSLAREELESLRAELHDLRHQVDRIPELEERLDFAERLLARHQEAARLAPGGE